MDETIIEITIDGTTYYCRSEDLRYIDYVDGKLVNTSDHTITLKHSFDTGTTYPYISASSMNQFTRRDSQNITNVPVRSNYVYNGDLYGTLNYPAVITVLLFILILLRLVWKR